MSDYNSSLPVRTEENGDLVTHLADGTINTQLLKVEADGSINVNASATDLDIRDLTSVSDSVEVLQDTHDDLNLNANIQVGDADVANGNPVPISDAGGSLTVDGTVAATQSGTWDIGTLTTITNDVNIADGGNSITVDAVDLDIRDITAVSDSIAAHLFDEAGAAFTSLNPLPVSFAADGDGDEVCDFNTSSAVAKDASVNHDYTVTAAKTFLAEEAWISGSGKLKVELLINGAIVFVGFNSTSNPNIRIPMEKICKANAAEVIRFTITNRDNQAQDVYSTLLGTEV